MPNTELTPGVYRLTKDIDNPVPDRRVKDDWRKSPTWSAGMLFIATQRHGDPWEVGDKVPVWCDLRSAGSRWSHYVLTPGNPGFDLIVSNIEPHQETDDTLLARLGVRSMSIYGFSKFLVKKMGHTDFTALWNEWESQEEE